MNTSEKCQRSAGHEANPGKMGEDVVLVERRGGTINKFGPVPAVQVAAWLRQDLAPDTERWTEAGTCGAVGADKSVRTRQTGENQS